MNTIVKPLCYVLLLACAWVSANAAAAPSNSRGKCRPAGEASFFPNDGLSARVEAKLLIEPLLRFEQIDVKGGGNVVTLTGNVSSSDRIALAGRLSGKVTGVRCVNNLLKVGPSLRDPDRRLNEQAPQAPAPR